jgi:hypothetical protein
VNATNTASPTVYGPRDEASAAPAALPPLATAVLAPDNRCDLAGSVNFTTYPATYPLHHLFDWQLLQAAPAPPAIQEARLPTSRSSNNTSMMDNNAPAVCEISRQVGYDRLYLQLTDFSLEHVLPYLVRCVSFWQSFAAHHAPVLYLPGWNPTTDNNDDLHAFVQRVLVERFTVQVVTRSKPPPSPLWAQPALREGPHGHLYLEGFAMHERAHAVLLQETVWDVLGLTKERNCTSETLPVLAMIKASQILEQGRLRRELSAALDLPIQMVDLVGLTFFDRIRALAHVDLLVASHNVELSVAFFLPQASALVELMAPNYFVPQQYGSLAATVGLDYAAVYTGSDVALQPLYTRKRWEAQALAALERKRKAQICVPLAPTLQAIRALLPSRQEACAHPTIVIPPTKDVVASVADGCLRLGSPTVTTTSYPTTHSLQDLVTVLQEPSNAPTAPHAAVCEFANVGYWGLFPHTMQQLYRCISFWQAYPDIPTVLVWPDDSKNRRYTIGIRNFLRQSLHVREVSNRSELDDPVSALIVQANHVQHLEDHPHQGIVLSNPADAALFRSQMLAYLEVKSIAGCGAKRVRPRIGILNRSKDSKRSLLNANALREQLQVYSRKPIKIVYFEDASFAEQVEYMANVDILVAPHGAQLTPINFMPACGSVVELAPPGYSFPLFFGPLAASAGLSHSLIYTGMNVTAEWDEMAKHSHALRVKSRHVNICVPLNVTVAKVAALVEGWRSCCGKP